MTWFSALDPPTAQFAAEMHRLYGVRASDVYLAVQAGIKLGVPRDVIEADCRRVSELAQSARIDLYDAFKLWADAKTAELPRQ